MTVNDFKVGDVLVYMWHYTMHFPVFFVVTRTTQKMVEVQEIEDYMIRSTDGGYNQQGYVVPKEPFVAKRYEKPRLCKIDNNGVVIRSISRSHHAIKWDNKPIYADYCD